jgi:methionyl-tRNA formyltransferase
MAEAVDAGAIVDRKFVPIAEDDTARTLYERTRDASISLFEEMLPAIVAGDVDGMGTPPETFDGERYFHRQELLADLKELPVDALADPDRETEVYDRIRALDFPPFEPAYVVVNDQRVYLTATSYEALFDGP